MTTADTTFTIPEHLRAPGTASGVIGVYPQAGGRWQARMRRRGKLVHLGSFATLPEAAAAVDDELRQRQRRLGLSLGRPARCSDGHPPTTIGT